MSEVAWDADGEYCGDRAQYAGGVLVCERCNRAVGWCFGGCDDSLCDDCRVIEDETQLERDYYASRTMHEAEGWR